MSSGELPSSNEFDVVFVVGLHKTGTSLLTERLSENFFDTSRETNPNEKGYGGLISRYFTRECLSVRHINEEYRVLSDTPPSSAISTIFDRKIAREGMISFLRYWRCPIVLKAPFFAYSLEDWLISAKETGRTPCVCVTHRNLQDVLAAWKRAPYTTSLFEQGEFKRLRILLHRQVFAAQDALVDVRHFRYEQIINSPSMTDNFILHTRAKEIFATKAL